MATAAGSTLPPLASPESDNSEAVLGASSNESSETASSANNVCDAGGALTGSRAGGGEAPACPNEVESGEGASPRERPMRFDQINPFAMPFLKPNSFNSASKSVEPSLLQYSQSAKRFCFRPLKIEPS